MQTKTYVNCPTCNSTRISEILGQVCPQCLGVGIVAVKTQDILADFSDARQPFEIVRLRGKVSNFQKKEDGFCVTLNMFPRELRFFFNPPAWLEDGKEACVNIRGGDAVFYEPLGLVPDWTFDYESMATAVEMFKADLKGLMAKYELTVKDEHSYDGEENAHYFNRLAIDGEPWSNQSFHEIITEAFGVVCLPEQ